MANQTRTTESSDPLLDFAYRAYIKSVYIHLPCYRFRHKPADDPKDHYFVGREKVESQLLSFLKNGMDSGAYLVTGFRGMGKTSLVKKTIERFIRECKENDKRKIKRVSISFGQKDLKELDILRQIANEVRKLVREDKWVRWYQLLNFKTGIGIGFIIFLILSITLPPHSDWWEIIKFWIWSFEANVEAMIVNLVISTALSSLIFMFVVFCFSRIEVIKIADAIEEVYDRCSSQITKESGTSGGSEQFPFGFSLKQVKSYPIASSKEISNELIDIIRDLHAQDWKLIFTFDELDKVENSQSNVSYYEDMEQWTSNEKTGSSLNDIRERKMMVLGILSSLKYLITEAPARFIFIAGSEMFDAALADISDRQSAISSIFNQVLNVDSLLKDKSNARLTGVGVTNMVEEYLERVILPRDYQEDKDKPFLSRLYALLKKSRENKFNIMAEEDILKVIYTLQHFIIYTTYRSNGSPKKMIKLMEDHMVPVTRPEEFRSSEKRVVLRLVPVYKMCVDKKFDSDIYLSLGYKNQYKIGLYNYIYRPIIISKSRNIKHYSDSLLVATPYLMDHLIKFHMFAFSLENLELLPEVLSTNRSPELRFFLEEMVQWYNQYLVRSADAQFYEYKFLFKIYNEISYLSKISEGESAAFNFTLDENYHVRLFLRVKIKELRSIYKDFGGSDPGNSISSIAFLNIMLGDSQFFDQEYGDAIVSYSDAFRAIQKINEEKNTIEPVPNDLYLSIAVKSLMKLGLTYEKMKSYETAYGCYMDVVRILSEKYEKIQGNTEVAPRSELLSRYFYNAILAAYFTLEKASAIGSIESVYTGVDKFSTIKYPFFHANLAILFYYRGIPNEKDDIYNLFKIIKLNDGLKPWIKDLSFQLNMFALDRLNNPEKESQYIKFEEENYLSLLDEFYELSKNDHWLIKSKDLLESGKILSRLGDILYCYLNEDNYDQFIESIFPDLEKFNQIEQAKEDNEADKDSRQNTESWLIHLHDKKSKNILEKIAYTYLLAAKLLLRGGNNQLGSYQYNKILLIFRGAKITFNNNQLNYLQESLVKRMLENASWNSGSSDRTQVYKYKHILGINTIFHHQGYSKYNYMNISNASELKEALINFAALRVNAFVTTEEGKIESIKDFMKIKEQAIINPVNIVSTQFTRLNELGLQCNINNKLCNKVFNTEILSKWENEYYKISKSINGFDYSDSKINQFFQDPKLLIRDFKEFPYLVANWMFCIHNILNIMKMMGESFLICHSNIADYHRRNGKILKYYELCRWLKVLAKREEIEIKDVDKLVNRLIGANTIGSVDSTSEYQLASRHYYMAIRTHTRGAEYQYFINNMSYLEDDYHDPSFHFSMAFERRRVLSGELMKHINDIRKETGDSQLFRYTSFANNAAFPGNEESDETMK